MYANEGLADRALATITRLASKLTRAATLLLLASIVICVGSFLLGMEALSGGIESVWIVLGFFFGAIAIGCASEGPLENRPRPQALPEIANEMRALVADGRSDVITIVIPDEALASGSALELSTWMSSTRACARSPRRGWRTAPTSPGGAGDHHLPGAGDRDRPDHVRVAFLGLIFLYRARPLTVGAGRYRHLSDGSNLA